MGTTLTALNTGIGRFAYAVMIEGYPYVLTNGEPAGVFTAFDSSTLVGHSDVTGALGGLAVDWDGRVTNIALFVNGSPFANAGGSSLTNFKPARPHHCSHSFAYCLGMASTSACCAGCACNAACNQAGRLETACGVWFVCLP